MRVYLELTKEEKYKTGEQLINNAIRVHNQFLREHGVYPSHIELDEFEFDCIRAYFIHHPFNEHYVNTEFEKEPMVSGMKIVVK